MSIIASAPAPAGSRLSTADTLVLPQLDRLSVTDAAERYTITAWAAFTMGARIRSQADVAAMAATFPPMTEQERADLARFCADVATWPVERVARTWRCSLATAEDIRELMAGGAR